MMTLLMVAAGACAASFAIGFIARRAVAGPLPGGAAPAITAPGRWGPLATALLRPDRAAAGLAIWLALLDAVLALAAPWPLKFVVDYALGHHPYPPWLSWMSAIRPVGVALAAAAAGLLLLLAAAVAGYLVTVLTTALSERMTVRLRAALIGHLLRTQPRSAAAIVPDTRTQSPPSRLVSSPRG